jgi:hypothetical protein
VVSTNDREKVLISRFRGAGLMSNRVQLEAPFSFVVSITTTQGVDTNESSYLARKFGNGIVERIRQWTMQSPITGIVVFPRILDENIAKIPDHLTYKRKEKAVFVSVNIPFNKWTASSAVEKIEILSETITEALGRIAPRYLQSKDRDALAHAVIAVRDAMASNHETRNP